MPFCRLNQSCSENKNFSIRILASCLHYYVNTDIVWTTHATHFVQSKMEAVATTLPLDKGEATLLD